MNISVISNVVAMMFTMLIVGFIVRKLKWVDEVTTKQITRIIIHIGQPMLIISSQIKVEYSAEKLINGGIVFVIGIVTHAILSVLAYFACLWIKDLNKRKISEFAMVFANCAFIGYPVIGAVLGDEGVFYATFYVISFNIFNWTWGMVILGRKRDDIKINLKSMLINFGTVPSFIGIAMYVLQPVFRVPTFIVDGMSTLGSLCTPLSVLLCGILLANVKLKQIFTRPQVYYTVLLRLIVLPLIVALVAKLIVSFTGLPDMLINIAIIMAALPTAANTAMFAELYDINQEYAAQIVGTSTALCVATVPLIVYLSGIIMAW